MISRLYIGRHRLGLGLGHCRSRGVKERRGSPGKRESWSPSYEGALASILNVRGQTSGEQRRPSANEKGRSKTHRTANNEYNISFLGKQLTGRMNANNTSRSEVERKVRAFCRRSPAVPFLIFATFDFVAHCHMSYTHVPPAMATMMDSRSGGRDSDASQTRDRPDSCLSSSLGTIPRYGALN